jgi:hypothetical protein
MPVNRERTAPFGILAILLLAAAPAFGQSRGSSSAPRLVLVELFTSQGCNMCPTAEKILGDLGDANSRVAPLAFHVDYFDKPWKDPFSDNLHSKRQMSYHQTYKGPKDPQLGLYYTPMVMVDGTTHVNGRDPEGLKAAVASARKKAPGVSIETELKRAADGKSVKLTTKVTSKSAKVTGKDQLLCAVLREDKVATEVKSGENADKKLDNRFPARKLLFEIVKLEARSPVEKSFDFAVDPSWNAAKLSLVVFVQDRKTGEIHQAAVASIDGK